MSSSVKRLTLYAIILLSVSGLLSWRLSAFYALLFIALTTLVFLAAVLVRSFIKPLRRGKADIEALHQFFRSVSFGTLQAGVLGLLAFTFSLIIVNLTWDPDVYLVDPDCNTSFVNQASNGRALKATVDIVECQHMFVSFSFVIVRLKRFSPKPERSSAIFGYTPYYGYTPDYVDDRFASVKWVTPEKLLVEANRADIVEINFQRFRVDGVDVSYAFKGAKTPIPFSIHI